MEPRQTAGWKTAAWTAFLLLTALAWALLAGMVQQVWLRLGLAGGSLVLLAIAGFVSIPPLLRRSLQRWLNRTVEFHFTAAGLPFILGLVVLLLAAFSSGNNLIYMVAACLLGALLTSGFASALNLSGMALRFQFPSRIFAGEDTPVQLILENEKSFLPAYSLTVMASSERLVAARRQPRQKHKKGEQPAGAAAASRGGPAAAPAHAATSVADDLLPRMRPAYFPYIARRGRVQVTSTLRFPQRGYYSSASFALSTRFPFALIDKRRRFRTSLREEAILIYPALAPADALHHSFPTLAAQMQRYEPGQGQELYRVRPHEETDGTRRIHWKATARAGQLQVREFTRESSRRLRIVVALSPTLSAAEVEQSISLCAALVWALAKTDIWLEFEGRNALAPPLVPRAPRQLPAPPSETAIRFTSAPAASHLDSILEYLALVDAQAPLLQPAPASRGMDGATETMETITFDGNLRWTANADAASAEAAPHSLA